MRQQLLAAKWHMIIKLKLLNFLAEIKKIKYQQFIMNKSSKLAPEDMAITSFPYAQDLL